MIYQSIVSKTNCNLSYSHLSNQIMACKQLFITVKIVCLKQGQSLVLSNGKTIMHQIRHCFQFSFMTRPVSLQKHFLINLIFCYTTKALCILRILYLCDYRYTYLTYFTTR